jgi:hypothetical protein
LERLMVHLVTLERKGMINTWCDTKIDPGAKWRDEIRQAIKSARVAVLLVSADFLASQFIIEDELPPLLAAAKKTKRTVILPVILSPCGFDSSSLSQFQAVNSSSKPLTNMNYHQKEELWEKVGKAIKAAISSIPSR